jgi:hypothetical protein
MSERDSDVLCQATRRVAAAALLCDRRRGHAGLHFDQPNMLWWAGNDNRGIGLDGLTLAMSDPSLRLAAYPSRSR